MGCCSDFSVEEKKNKFPGKNQNNNIISNKHDENHLNHLNHLNNDNNNVNKSEFHDGNSPDNMNNNYKKSINKKNTNAPNNKNNKEYKKREPEKPKKIVQEIKPEKIEIKKNGTNKIDKKKDKKIEKNQEEFAKKALNHNNYYRELYEVDKLELDDYLIKRANIIAQEYLTRRDFDNDNLLYENFEDIGINDYFSDKELKPEELIEIWIKEGENYNYQDINEIECKNFTQMIWKNSKKFGIGYYSSDDHLNINNGTGEHNIEKKFYYVALYYPIGNKSGEFPENVKNIDIHEKIKKRKEEEEEKKRKEEEEEKKRKEEEEEKKRK